jgi:hypothetical protein
VLSPPRVDPRDVALVVTLPAAATLCMALSAGRLWMVSAFGWWFALSALPLLLLMTGRTRGRSGAALLAIGAAALAASCAANLELLDRCAEGCHFARAG